MFWLDSFPLNEIRLNLYFEVVVAKDLEGIWIIDAEAKTAYASERMAEILGTTAAEMVGQASFAYLFPEDVPAGGPFKAAFGLSGVLSLPPS